MLPAIRALLLPHARGLFRLHGRDLFMFQWTEMLLPTWRWFCVVHRHHCSCWLLDNYLGWPGNSNPSTLPSCKAREIIVLGVWEIVIGRWLSLLVRRWLIYLLGGVMYLLRGRALNVGEVFFLPGSRNREIAQNTQARWEGVLCTLDSSCPIFYLNQLSSQISASSRSPKFATYIKNRYARYKNILYKNVSSYNEST